MHQVEKKEIWYTCEFCKRRFRSGRERPREKLCRNCIELRRLIRTWAKEGVWAKEAQGAKSEQEE